LWSIGTEVESTLKQKVVKLMRVRTIEGVWNVDLQLVRLWCRSSVKVFQ